MNFWNLSVPDPASPALRFGGGEAEADTLSYSELALQSDAFAARLGPRSAKRLGIITCRNALPAVLAYLGGLRCGDAVMLLGDPPHDMVQAILEAYRPDWIFRPKAADKPAAYTHRPDREGWELLVRTNPGDQPPHPDLALLLSTSGTTGSPKMVRLSWNNIDANAASIVNYLGIQSTDRTVTTLPLNYSYGISVLHSHLRAGASVLLTDAGLLTRQFWDEFRAHDITSLAGVPYTYQILHRLNPRKLPLSSLATFTQAGGRLAPKLVDYFREFAEERQLRFFVMYGQTEASPRISFVPPERLAEKAGAIGIPIPGCGLSISTDGELLFHGPNVMMGYALARDDLARGDEMHGRLATGDLATVDADGFYYLQGRIKRFIKIHGNRINLDDIESKLEGLLHHPVAALGHDDRLDIFLDGDVDPQAVSTVLSQAYRLHASTFRVRQVPAIPYTTAGKKDYAKLEA